VGLPRELRFDRCKLHHTIQAAGCMMRWAKFCGAILAAAAVIAVLLAGAPYLFGVYQANKFAKEGERAAALGDYNTAIARYSAALKKSAPNPQKALLYTNRGAAYNSKRQCASPIADHTEAIRLNPGLSYAYAARGWAYLQQGELEKAFTDLSEAIRLDPNSQSAYYDRGLVLARRGDLDQALMDFDEAVRCSPNRVDPLVARALCYLAKNDLDRALASFDGAIATDSTNALGYIGRSALYGRKSEWDKEERDYEQAFRLNPNIGNVWTEFAQWFGDKRSRVWPREFVTPAAGKDVRQLFREAEAFYNHGNYEGAIALWNAILATDISAVEAASATMNRGNAYAAKGDLDNALRDYNQAVALDPGNAEVYVNRALTLSRRGDVEGAMKDYNLAVTLNPRQWQAYFNRAAELRKHSRSREALDDLNEVIKLNPRFAGAYVNRANIYIGEGRLSEAIHDCTTALKFDPNSAEAHLLRGNLSWRNRNYAQALSDLQAAVRLNPKKLDAALNSLAWFRATCSQPRMRNGKKAVELATKACELSQWKNAGFIDTLAAAYAETGNFEQAIKYQREALAISSASNNTEADMRKRLELYNQHKPYREK
jgi:tetratricopeptide (TPR) repeat protein